MPLLDLAIRALSAPAARALARPLMKRRATVFMLHRVRCDEAGLGGHTPDEVRQSVRALRRSGANICSIRDLVAHGRTHGNFPTDAVAFTIDDGFSDQALLARALLDEGVTPTIFLITGFLDGRLWPWDDRVALAVRNLPLDVHEARVVLPGLEWTHPVSTPADRRRAAASLQDWLKQRSHDDIEGLLRRVLDQMRVAVPASPPPAYAPLTWDDARQLEREGVDFAPHSVTHRIFSRLADADAQAELAESRDRLQRELDRPLGIFAWPTGRAVDFTPRDVDLAADMGFEAAFATCDDYSVISADAARATRSFFSLARFSLPHSSAALLQYGSWIERAKQVVRGEAPRVNF